MGRRTVTGSAYVPPSGLQPSLHTSSTVSPTTNSQSEIKLSSRTNYKGTDQGTKTIENLDDHLNCSVFVIYLPLMTSNTMRSSLTLKVLLGLSQQSVAWKVFTFEINVFPQYIMNTVWSNTGMVQHPFEHMSRVLHLEGPSSKMTENFWIGYFDKITEYQLEYVGYLLDDGLSRGRRAMEFRFPQVEAQAQAILLYIINDYELEHQVKVRYGDDPCGWGRDSLEEQ
ncbi:hypothetical protein NHQ30_004489 [Ciborinia camelliae]|nr:hypothetical protein NHQ30_004489 [Ciborinia camelliae]